MTDVGSGPGGTESAPRDKGFRDRKREDHALLLIEELRSSLGNLARVRRILLELGRFYDPVLGGAIIEVAQQKAIVEALEAGDPGRAAGVIGHRYDLYIRDRAHLGKGGGGSGPRDDE